MVRARWEAKRSRATPRRLAWLGIEVGLGGGPSHNRSDGRVGIRSECTRSVRALKARVDEKVGPGTRLEIRIIEPGDAPAARRATQGLARLADDQSGREYAGKEEAEGVADELGTSTNVVPADLARVPRRRPVRAARVEGAV